MLSEYTPTTAEVRGYFAHGQSSEMTLREAVAAFNRWLAAHDAEVRADQIEKDAAIADSEASEWATTTYQHFAATHIAAAIRAQLNEGKTDD